MEDLIKKYHAAQYRNRPEVPYLEHLVGVASILKSTLALTGECTNEAVLQDMYHAALGHDLLEDTEVTKDEILQTTNPRTLKLIEELSNPVDDAHTDAYMAQLSTASEEARLIKYCDLVENTTSVCYGLHELGLDWANNFYLPILTRSTATLAKTNFTQFPKTAALLRAELQIATNLLDQKIKLIKERK